jgi:hypothetical protein
MIEESLLRTVAVLLLIATSVVLLTSPTLITALTVSFVLTLIVGAVAVAVALVRTATLPVEEPVLDEIETVGLV